LCRGSNRLAIHSTTLFSLYKAQSKSQSIVSTALLQALSLGSIIVCHITAIINLCPLLPIIEHPDDIDVLTLGHFLDTTPRLWWISLWWVAYKIVSLIQIFGNSETTTGVYFSCSSAPTPCSSNQL